MEKRRGREDERWTRVGEERKRGREEERKRGRKVEKKSRRGGPGEG